MADWPAELAARAARDGGAMLVVIARANGSTPREAGTLMIVGAHDTFGTIGGGHLEFEAIRMARDALANVRTPSAWLVRFPLAARLGQCCGGVATLAFIAVSADPEAQRWLDAAGMCLRTATPMALVTRIGGTGERRVPMLVAADRVTGSLGERELDAAGIALARPLIRPRGARAVLIDSPAGGGATLLIHVVTPEDLPVALFGNGHVGRALVQVLGALPANVRWIDARDSDFPPTVPENVEVVATDAPEAELAGLRPGTFVIVATHSHALDYEIVAAALARDDWAYVGLIGSRAKRNQFEKRLAARGFTPEQLARVTCPIGATGGFAIRSKEPGAIAVAVAAELLMLRENADSTRIGKDDEPGAGVPNYRA
jgi:xanthine dehydrogenase accessory factor